MFESLAYAAGFTIYNRQRTRSGDFLEDRNRSSVIVAAVAGAAIGSKVLGWFEHPAEFARHWHHFAWLMEGKTIVGGLLGGTIAVEGLKRHLRIERRTGDLFAFPLALAIAVGRIGCFLAGMNDRTFGNPTAVSWAVDFGDGVGRHPTQIYEVLLLSGLAIFLRRLQAVQHREGDLFRAFLFLYMTWRLAIEFIKPDSRIGPLTAIQWACLAAMLWYAPDAFRILNTLSSRERVVRIANG